MICITDILVKIPFARDCILPLISSPIRRRLASGAFWSGIGGAVSRFSVLVTSFFIARLLGQTHFGEYGVVNSTTAMLSAVAGLGVGATATKYVAELRNTDKGRAGRVISLASMVTWASGGLYGLIVLCLAPWLATKTLAAPHLSGALQISSISVALGVINGAQQSALAGFEAFRRSAYIMIGCGLFQSFSVCFGAYLGQLQGAVWGSTVAMVVTVIATHVALSGEMSRFGISNCWHDAVQEWPVLINFSLPAFLTTLVAGPVYWACNALLANQTNGYGELGIFNAANQWYAVVGFLPGVISTAVLPVFSERFGAKDVAGSINVMRKMMLITSFFAIPMVIVLGLFGQSIMRGYGASFEDGWGVLILSMAAAAAQAVTVPCWSTIMASGRMWVCFVMNIGWSVLLLIGSVCLINYGAMGVASARFVAFVVHGCWIYAYVSWMVKKDQVNFETN